MLAAPSPQVRLIFPTCGYGAAIILAFLRPASFTPVAEQPLIDALLVVHYSHAISPMRLTWSSSGTVESKAVLTMCVSRDGGR